MLHLCRYKGFVEASCFFFFWQNLISCHKTVDFSVTPFFKPNSRTDVICQTVHFTRSPPRRVNPPFQYCNCSIFFVGNILGMLNLPSCFTVRSPLGHQDDPALKGTKADPEFVTCLSEVSCALPRTGALEFTPSRVSSCFVR